MGSIVEKLGIWQLIKYGFWLGIGFIIPMIIFTFGSTYLAMFAMPVMMDSAIEEYETEYFESGSDSETSFSSFSFPDYDISDQIEIQGHRLRKDGNRVSILGSIINNSEQQASSIHLEAEFINEVGEFVYECMDFMSLRLGPGQVENFQISCGCGDVSLPAYSDYTVRVTHASRS